MNTVTKKRVTLYFNGEMFGNYHKVEASAFDFEIRNYAQYPSAVRLTYVPRGARVGREKWFTSYPSLVILDGWGHPEPAPMMGPTDERVAGVTVSKSRFSAFDGGWKAEFRAMLAAHVEKSGATVILDLHDHSPNAPFVGPLVATPAERYAAERAAFVSFTHFNALGDGCACETPADHEVTLSH